MEDRRLSLLIDFIERGEKSCKETSENKQNRQSLRDYYLGKANAFGEVSDSLRRLKTTNDGNSIDNSNRGDSIDDVFAAIGQ